MITVPNLLIFTHSDLPLRIRTCTVLVCTSVYPQMEMREEKQQQVAMRNKVHERRVQSARARKYYDEYQVRARAKQLGRRTREEAVSALSCHPEWHVYDWHRAGGTRDWHGLCCPPSQTPLLFGRCVGGAVAAVMLNRDVGRGVLVF